MSDRERLRRQRAREVDSLEHSVFNHLYLSLVQWLKMALDRILSPFRMFGVAPDPAAVWSVAGEWDKVVDHMVDDHFTGVADAGGHAQVSGNSYVQAQLARTRNLLVRIPDDVYNLIFAEISDAVNKGEDNKSIAARIEKVLSDTASERWRNRAMTIARTETIRAYNAGALGSGMRAEQIEGQAMTKEWLATEDKATRSTHRAADGQQRLLLQPFQVGGSSLMFPGDPLGDPDEVINCRCTMLVKGAGDD